MNATPLPETLQCYLSFCRIRKRYQQTGLLELDLDFVYPTTLLPLAVLRAHSGAAIRATNPSVQGYVRWVTNAEAAPAGGTYVPVVRLPASIAEYRDVIERLNDLSATTTLFAVNQQAYRYILSELIGNIYEHAEANHSFVMAQAYTTQRLIEASFMDDGQTIAGSLERGTNRRYTPEDSYNAILDALDGTSSKGSDERGFGLRSSVRLANELGGEVLIVSGRGAVVIGPTRLRSPFVLEPDHALSGTLVGLRLPEGDKRVNLYEFVEG